MNNTDGDEYAQDTITVNIDRPADIDDKDIICSWENGKFSDTITLQFKVYVPAYYSDNSQHCDKCQHGVHLKLKRPGIQKKEDINLEEKIKQKVMREYNVADVFIDSYNYICGCKPQPKTIDFPPTSINNNRSNTIDFPSQNLGLISDSLLLVILGSICGIFLVVTIIIRIIFSLKRRPDSV